MEKSTIDMIKQTLDRLNQEIEAIGNVKIILVNLLAMEDDKIDNPDKLLHWTQDPANRRKMLKVVRQAQAARLGA